MQFTHRVKTTLSLVSHAQVIALSVRADDVNAAKLLHGTRLSHLPAILLTSACEIEHLTINMWGIILWLKQCKVV